MTMEMAVLDEPSRHADTTSTLLSRMLRTALLWALGSGILAVAGWALAGHPVQVAGAAGGAGLALVFLASGRSVQVLARTRNLGAAMTVFLTQLLVLGVVGGLIAQHGGAGRWGMPAATGVLAVALGWTAGVVVAGRRRNQPIYERRAQE